MTAQPASHPSPFASTLVEKIWQQHRVTDLGDDIALLYIDRHFLHERSGGRMLEGVLAAGRTLFDAASVFGTIDHIVDTNAGRSDITKFPGGTEFIRFFRENAQRAGVEIFDLDDARQGIVHIIAPELGITHPGMTMVCGDSHTSTMGGMGALAWGIGITQGEHALSTHCLAVRKPRSMRVTVGGYLTEGVTAKDLILSLIGRHGAAGGRGCAIEFAGPAMRAMSPEGRMTICNMAVEFGGWTGIVQADDKIFNYLHERPFAPAAAQWDSALAHWRSLKSDNEARFDIEISVDARDLRPQITWGTSGEHVINIDGRVPDPADVDDVTARGSLELAMDYMGVAPGDAIEGLSIDAAFIGSCTNSRIEDLRSAAHILRGRKVAKNVLAICVPGSTAVKHAAEAEGLHRVFIDAGFDWREAGCSLCFYAGGDHFGTARRVVSSTNRNFQNRQGPGVRTHLASPATVAASAVAGRIADPSRPRD